jgi:hypothetical protein
MVDQINNDLLDEYFPSHDGDRWRAPNVGAVRWRDGWRWSVEAVAAVVFRRRRRWWLGVRQVGL